MKTYYSIIKVAPNSLAGDSISIGLVLSDDDNFFVKFSNTRIRIAKSLLGENKRFLDFFISKIENSLESIKSNNSIEKNLFKFQNKINANYFSYLNRYNQNIIQYDEPKYIKEKNSLETLDKLFSLMVDKETPQPKIYKVDQIHKVSEVINRKLITRVKDKVHTNIKFTDKYIPSLYFKYEMDCIGLNGVFTGAKSVFFNQSEVTIQKEISNYYALSTMLENMHNRYGLKNNFYLISDEPNEIGSKQHQLWEKLMKGKKFNVIHSEEADLVALKIEETKAKTFLDIE
ncbi:DUF3037 domain-containing protein [Marinifilum flexuosum]|uniref:DUF3037 family protein n=1 Tax=Marinifilum flexuosum TaxID=1117708 RepID=A0A419X9J2_9BACT|nr:DUF3037 domain-containing protein [Marinifilum flexuosum]RKE04434.1 Protein of unknown function (DUF3037) [Marinifilum flexuosum]